MALWGLVKGLLKMGRGQEEMDHVESCDWELDVTDSVRYIFQSRSVNGVSIEGTTVITELWDEIGS